MELIQTLECLLVNIKRFDLSFDAVCENAS